MAQLSQALHEIKFPDYDPAFVAKQFHASSATYRGIMGPVGTGKTVTCCMEVLSRACEQRIFNGVRRSRWAFVRNTYSELISTTMKTWQEWVPEALCPISRSPPITGRLNIKLQDGTKVELEILFLALDRDDDVHKMKSLELTGIFLNEVSEIRKSIFDISTTRLRFPGKLWGGSLWKGIIMDTNPPSDDHWYYRLAEIERPEGFEFFRYPPAMIPTVVKCDDVEKKLGISATKIVYKPNRGQDPRYPAADYVRFYDEEFEYWERMIPGKLDAWVKVFVAGEYGTLMTGRPVYPEYTDSLHCTGAPLAPYRGLPLLLGWDFGLTPACIFGQLTPQGKLRILDERCSEDMGITRFIREVVRPLLLNSYAGMRLLSCGDPAGTARSQTDEVTCMQILHAEGIPTDPAPTNSFIARREAVVYFLTRMVDGAAGFELDNKSDMLRKGFQGKYQYAKIKTGSSDRFQASPEKNEWSHPHDALQYLCLLARTASITGDSDTGADIFGMDQPILPVDKLSASGWT